MLAAVLKGVDLTGRFSPQRATKLGKQYRLVPGDSCDLRAGYDLSDDRAQASVMDEIDQSQLSQNVLEEIEKAKEW